MYGLMKRIKNWLIVKLGGNVDKPILTTVRVEPKTVTVFEETLVNEEFLHDPRFISGEAESAVREQLAFGIAMKMCEQGLIEFRTGIGKPEYCQRAYRAIVKVIPPMEEEQKGVYR